MAKGWPDEATVIVRVDQDGLAAPSPQHTLLPLSIPPRNHRSPTRAPGSLHPGRARLGVADRAQTYHPPWHAGEALKQMVAETGANTVPQISLLGPPPSPLSVRERNLNLLVMAACRVFLARPVVSVVSGGAGAGGDPYRRLRRARAPGLRRRARSDAGGRGGWSAVGLPNTGGMVLVRWQGEIQSHMAAAGFFSMGDSAPPTSTTYRISAPTISSRT